MDYLSIPTNLGLQADDGGTWRMKIYEEHCVAGFPTVNPDPLKTFRIGTNIIAYIQFPRLN